MLIEQQFLRRRESLYAEAEDFNRAGRGPTSVETALEIRRIRAVQRRVVGMHVGIADQRNAHFAWSAADRTFVVAEAGAVGPVPERALLRIPAGEIRTERPAEDRIADLKGV